jgi:flavin-dependent dehydrogenase
VFPRYLAWLGQGKQNRVNDSTHSTKSCMLNIVIAGCGFAGGVMALRSLQLGFGVILLDVPRPDIGGVEIVPSSARHLLSELQLDGALAAARPGYGVGMLRWLDAEAPEFRDGRALHVDRLALRRAVIAEAASRGVEIRCLRELPEPDESTFASIDATGRRAAWSRPVKRYGRRLADVFSAPGLTDYDAALVVGLGRGWCYAAADQAGTTIAVIHDGGQPRPQIERAIRGTFGIPPEASLIYLGRRPAFPQAAAAPLRGRVIAIGDAAFCHDPIGGRGLSFALGCAFAAGAVLQTWRDQPARWQEAAAYYEDFVGAEQRRHLAFLSRHQEAARQSLPSHVVWAAKKARAPLALPKGIELADVALTETGAPVRWLGRFDILELQSLCDRGQPTRVLIEALVHRGLIESEARAVLVWALRNAILRAGNPNSSAAENSH